jgi:hypothetical protein
MDCTDKKSAYFLVIHNSSANPTDRAEFIAKRYGAAASTIFFIDGSCKIQLSPEDYDDYVLCNE